MRVAVDTQEMKTILGRLSALLDGRSELESFRVLRVDVVNGKLRFSSATSSMYASDIYEKDDKRRSSIEPFGVDGKEFYEAIKVLGASEGDCTLVIDKTFVVVEKGRSKLRLTKYSDDVLTPIERAWPEMDENPYQELSVQSFCKAIKKVLFVPEGDPERDPHASAVHINNDHIVATNRKVLAVRRNGIIRCPDVPFHMTSISAEKLVKLLSSLEGTCHYLLKNHFLYISCGPFRARLSGAVMAYPAYRSVMLGHTDNFTFQVDKKQLVTALKTAGIAMFRTPGLKKVCLSFEKDGLHVDCEAGKSSSSAVVPIETHTTVPAKVIYEQVSKLNPFALDLDLLLEGVGSMSDNEFLIRIDSRERPVIFSEEDYDLYIGLLRV